ncbi:MAG: hypothetical protein VXY77_01245 [Pseudomonadota bacterium]|nr:hypothetical protein [Pseudomonadota bacterium]
MRINLKNLALAGVLCTALSGCVPNKEVMVVQPGDYDMSCNQLKTELELLGVRFQDSKTDSGLTGKNILSGVFFWPGIVFNEHRAAKNTESIIKRSEHLSRLYSQKCASKKSSQ